MLGVGGPFSGARRKAENRDGVKKAEPSMMCARPWEGWEPVPRCQAYEAYCNWMPGPGSEQFDQEPHLRRAQPFLFIIETHQWSQSAGRRELAGAQSLPLSPSW